MWAGTHSSGSHSLRLKARPRSASSISLTARLVRASRAACSSQAWMAYSRTSASTCSSRLAGPRPALLPPGSAQRRNAGELGEHQRMLPQHRIAAEVGRAAVEQVRHSGDVPVQNPRRPNPIGPAGRGVCRRGMGFMIFELMFDDHPWDFRKCGLFSVPIGNRIGLSRCSLRPGPGRLSILDTKMVRIWLMSSASSSLLSHSGICRYPTLSPVGSA